MASKYNQEVAKYGKKDTAIALCAYALLIVSTIVYWAIMESIDDPTLMIIWLSGVAVSVVNIAITFAFVLIRKQTLASIGLHKEKLGKALALGAVFALIPLAINAIAPAVFYDLELLPVATMAVWLPYSFALAFQEDIFFVGFLQTRLYGVFKTDTAAISAGAVLFSLMHIPVGIAGGGLGFLGPELIMYLVGLFFMHQMLVLLFRKYFSMATVVIVHTLVNWSYQNIWRWTAETDYGLFWGTVASIVLVVVVNIWSWRSEKLSGN